MAAGIRHHEEIYRGNEAVETLGNFRILICGAGALGSNLAENLFRQGANNLVIVDDDRVEEHNLGTQVYHYHDVGAKKADALQQFLYSVMQEDVDVVGKRLEKGNVKKLLRDIDLVVDTFDNNESRQLVQDAVRDSSSGRAIECVHAGLFEDYGEVVWDEKYRVPKDHSEGDVCDYPLARNIVVFTAVLACEIITKFMLDGVKLSKQITLNDLRILDR